MNKYSINYREFLNGKEINHIYKILDEIYIKYFNNQVEKKVLLKK